MAEIFRGDIESYRDLTNSSHPKDFTDVRANMVRYLGWLATGRLVDSKLLIRIRVLILSVFLFFFFFMGNGRRREP